MCLKVQLVSRELQFRQGLRTLLERESDLVVAHEAGSAAEATTAAKVVRPDVVVIDDGLHDALAAVAAIKRARPRGRVMLLAGRPSTESVTLALSAGASGFVSKLQPPRELIGAIRVVGGGGSYLCPDIVPVARRSEAARRKLDDRELAVYDLLVAGRSLDDAARELGVSARTAAAIRARILHKLELRSSDDLARFAVDRSTCV